MINNSNYCYFKSTLTNLDLIAYPNPDSMFVLIEN